MLTVLVVDLRDFTPLGGQLDEGLLAQTIGTGFGTRERSFAGTGPPEIKVLAMQ
jgi:hypothetical protein